MGEAEDASRESEDDRPEGDEETRDADEAKREAEDAPRKAPKKRKKKRKRKAKAKKDDPSAEPSEGAAKKEASPPRRRPWWLLLLLVGLLELFFFGSRGRMRVCVARDGEHDFALVDQPRTEENTRQYPTCVKRTNIGIVSKYDDTLTEATGYACQRAAVLRPTAVLYQCILKQDGWQHRIETEFVPPWDPIYYRRLFWFAFEK